MGRRTYAYYITHTHILLYTCMYKSSGGLANKTAAECTGKSKINKKVERVGCRCHREFAIYMYMYERGADRLHPFIVL